MRLKGYHLIRRIFRGLDSQLYKAGIIGNKNDSQYLHFNEILKISRSDNYKELIQDRKAQYEIFATEKPHRRYIQINDRFEPDLSNIEIPATDKIKGLGCCRGQVEAEVIFHEDVNSESIDINNKIVLAKFIEPVNIGRFSKAAGIILERGNLLSHTAILCRELGIPSIVGAKNARSVLTAGDNIIMNGSTGEIIKLNEK